MLHIDTGHGERQKKKVNFAEHASLILDDELVDYGKGPLRLATRRLSCVVVLLALTHVDNTDAD